MAASGVMHPIVEMGRERSLGRKARLSPCLTPRHTAPRTLRCGAEAYASKLRRYAAVSGEMENVTPPSMVSMVR